MKTDELFTIILTNYNQEKYIFNALDSIFLQNYNNVELIISDDCSKIFKKKEIEQYIIKKSINIKKIKFIINKENLGTVKTVNKCLKEITGKYILLFAADDALNDKSVIKRFVKSFNKNKKIYIISSICELCDINLNHTSNYFPAKKWITSFNKLGSKKQNWVLRTGPVFAPGATAYRTDLFKELNYLDEQYYLIEDWSWFLRCSRNSYKIIIEDFIGLKHRAGGISETNKLSQDIIKKILLDTYNIYKNEVFRKFKSVPFEYRIAIFTRYKLFIKMYNRFNSEFFIYYWFKLFSDSKTFFYKLSFKNKYINLIFSLFLSIILSIIIYNFYTNIVLISLSTPILYFIILRLLRR